jgi:serine/threonine-protein kinase HipA
MYTPVNVIQVYAWGEFVGALALDPRLGFYAFEYDPRWLRCRGSSAMTARPKPRWPS